MKKILLISNNGNGFYNFKRELVTRLLEIGYEVHFATPAYKKLVDIIAEGAHFHEIFIDRRGTNIFKDLGLLRQFRRIIKEVQPDIMIAHTIKPNIYASILSKRYGIPYMNNITGLGSALQRNDKAARILRMLYRVSLSNSQSIFFENVGNRNYFERYNIGNVGRYVVVPGAGVNIDLFNPSLKSEPSKKLNGTVFLFIARIMREKGIEEYLEAAQYIKKKYLSATFQVLGPYEETVYMEKIKEMESTGTVEFLGTSEDTRTEMSRADCIVLPSYHEGMSNVLLEGAAMGLPLITTDIPGCREAVCDGMTGFLCKTKSSESLINALERFLSLSPSERLEMGVQGREKMIKEFDRRLVVGRYVKAIQEAIGESSL